MRAAPWYVVFKAQQCSDCEANSLDMTVELCGEHVDEPIGIEEELAVLGVACGALSFLAIGQKEEGRGYLNDLLDQARNSVRRYTVRGDG